MIYNIDGCYLFPSANNGRGVIIYAKSEYNFAPNLNLNAMYHDASWLDWTIEDTFK